MSTVHHPSHAWLLDYATGNAPPLFETVLRAHIGVCPTCRDEIAFAERPGGKLIAGADTVGGALTADAICDRHE